MGLGSQVFSNRTAIRFFNGERIHDELALDILKEFAEGLVDGHIIPIPQKLESEKKFQELVYQVVKRCSERWDQIVGHMRSMSFPVTRKDLAPLPYLRLAIIDLSFRIVGILRLNGINEYPDKLPIWAEEGGNSKFLKNTLDNLGDARPTRENIHDDVGVSDNTVDSWIDKGIRPSDTHLSKLAQMLGERLEGTMTEELLGSLRRQYLLSSLVEKLTSQVGHEAVEDLSTALMRFISRLLVLLKEKSDSAAPGDIILVSLSTEWKGIDILLEHLWNIEEDPVWREDLLASYGKQLLRLQHTAQILGSLDEAKAQFKKEFNVSDEIAEKISKELERSAQADPIRSTPGTEGLTRIRVRGDAKFSARNRSTQALQAKAEGELESAITHLHRAIELQPQNAEYHFFLGAYLGEKGEFQKGLQECWIASSLNPEWDKPIVEVGIILMNSGRNQEALEHMESIYSTFHEKTTHLRTTLGHARMRCDDYLGALTIYDTVIKDVPDHGLVLDRAAHCAFLEGNGNKGRSYAKKANQLGFSETYKDWRTKKYRF